MRRPLHDIQPALAYAANHLDEDVSLAALAEKTGLSPFHLHRLFAAVTGETPKVLTTRLRLGRAAVMLLTTENSVLEIALSCGFQSHEVFTRAFRRRFGMTPAQYRKRGFIQPVDAAQAKEHAEVVERTSPCVGLYHVTENGRLTSNPMSYTVTVVELASQPVIVGTKRVKRSEIAANHRSGAWPRVPIRTTARNRFVGVAVLALSGSRRRLDHNRTWYAYRKLRSATDPDRPFMGSCRRRRL